MFLSRFFKMRLAYYYNIYYQLIQYIFTVTYSSILIVIIDRFCIALCVYCVPVYYVIKNKRNLMNFAFGRRKCNRHIKPLRMQQVFLNGVHLWLNIKNKTWDLCRYMYEIYICAYTLYVRCASVLFIKMVSCVVSFENL